MNKLLFLLFLTSIAFLSLLFGVYVGHRQVFPFSHLKYAYKEYEKLFLGKYHFLLPIRYEGENVIIYDKEKANEGVTFITGVWKDEETRRGYKIGAKLYSMKGEILHEWNIDEEEFSTLTDKDLSYSHGSHLLPNGDVILVLEYSALIKLDKDSNIRWVLPIPVHHTLTTDDEGNLWTLKYVYDADHSTTEPRGDDVIVQLSPDGEVLREISVYQSLIDSGYDGLLRLHSGDLLHTNDVEVLSKKKAAAFPLFNSGDILVSSREINTVFVIDGKSEKVKWSLTHPFIGQHDPDFTEDGKILVFDNHSNWKDPAAEKRGSRILLIDPLTNTIETVYGQKEGEYFYTARGGKEQQLPNGNILITEAGSGRVFEITPEKEIVWSWLVPKWDKRYQSEILEGTRYPLQTANFITSPPSDEH